jgi:imidazolonepropionase
VDVFCESIAFDLDQSRRILRQAQALGFPLKIHADEFDNLGGAALAAELDAASADHLVKTSPADITALAKSLAVARPAHPSGWGRRITRPPGQFWRPADCRRLPATQPLHGLVRKYAVRYCAGLPQPGTDPGAGDCRGYHNAAAAFNARAHRLTGSGKQADLLGLNVSDYCHLGYRFAATSGAGDEARPVGGGNPL